MKINILDGGMIFEINKKYSDYGQFAIKYDHSFIENIYKSYIDIGCRYITTCNYCFTPTKLEDWKDLCKTSVDIIQKFRNDEIKVFGSIPPFFSSYQYEEINDKFIHFYDTLIKIFRNKVDYYIIETSIDFNHVNEICKMIKKLDSSTNIIVSLYINDRIETDITKFLDLDVYGIFFNCCSFQTLVNFYDKKLRHLSFNKKIFGFYCNKINEKSYSKASNITELQKFKNNENIKKENLNFFLNSLNFEEIFIGGCCGYGIEDMKELISFFN